jgi:hypothetical protein
MLESQVYPLSKCIPNKEQLGHYLAGFIDGDGHFSKAQQLVVVFIDIDIPESQELLREK